MKSNIIRFSRQKIFGWIFLKNKLYTKTEESQITGQVKTADLRSVQTKMWSFNKKGTEMFNRNAMLQGPLFKIRMY